MIALSTECTYKVLVSGEQTEGRFAVIEVHETRGAEPPRHLHTREDEVIYVLEGHVSFERNGELLDGPSGMWLFLPRGSEHAVTVLSNEARLLVVLSPAGLEQSLPELARLASPLPDPLMIERLVAVAARYGVSITGPGSHHRATEYSPEVRG